MRKQLIGLALLASGCGNNLSAPSPLSRVRQACGDYAYDTEIDAIISEIDAGRDYGYSYSETITANYALCQDACWDYECELWCYGCASAAIDYVYGR